MNKISEIKERLSKATSGPWKASLSETDCNLPPRVACPNNRDCETCPHVYTIEGAWIYGPESVECGDYTYFNDADAELMAHAPGDIAYLLAEVERLKAELAQYKAVWGKAEFSIPSGYTIIGTLRRQLARSEGEHE